MTKTFPSTAAAFVASHADETPPALVSRVLEVLGEHPEWNAVPTAEALLGAGEQLLASVLAEEKGEGRDVALDLLAADACVTWAFEAAADAPRTLGARAEAAMQRIAEVAG